MPAGARPQRGRTPHPCTRTLLLAPLRHPRRPPHACAQGSIAAYITDYAVVKGLQNEPPCDLAVSLDTFGPGQLVIGLQPNSSLEEPLNLALLLLLEVGDVMMWIRTPGACARPLECRCCVWVVQRGWGSITTRPLCRHAMWHVC